MIINRFRALVSLILTLALLAPTGVVMVPPAAAQGGFGGGMNPGMGGGIGQGGGGFDYMMPPPQYQMYPPMQPSPQAPGGQLKRVRVRSSPSRSSRGLAYGRRVMW